MKQVLSENRKKLISLGILAVLLILLILLRGQKALMSVIYGATLWLRQGLGALLSYVPFSVMELLIAAAVVGVIVFLVLAGVHIVRAKGRRIQVLFRRLLCALNAVAALLLALWVLHGAGFYGESFADKSGITPVSADAGTLYRVTVRFADALSQAADEVARDDTGAFAVSKKEIFAQVHGLYDGICTLYPFLEAPETNPKKLVSSRMLSAFGYTGIYFPFTGEANINVDAPACLMPATIAHELAHQRGVVSEQEANFVAILACLESGNAVYRYSGLLSGYIHLSNALYQADRELFSDAWSHLSDAVRRDIDNNNAYWAQFESPVTEVGERVYDTFLKSYGQELGIRSYGAVVDMLVAYYADGL